jgi:hypothetical protein
MRNINWMSLLALFVVGPPLQAEIEQIDIRWNAFKCLETCVPFIERGLQAIPQVTHIQVNAKEGTASMGWNPTVPFSYEPFKLASATAGIHFDEMRMRVKGTVSHEGDHLYLTSSGDHTRFLLIGPLKAEPGRYVPRFNVATRPLTGDAKNQLLDAEKNGLMVTISGPLFLPSSHSLTLMAEHIKIYESK